MKTETLETTAIRTRSPQTITGWSRFSVNSRNDICRRFTEAFAITLDKGTANTIQYVLETKRVLLRPERQNVIELWQLYPHNDIVKRQIANYFSYFNSIGWVYNKRYSATLVEPKLVGVSYVDKKSVDRLLDDIGTRVLTRIVSIINDLNQDNAWNLNKIEICYVRDFDVKDWEYILIRLFLPTDFDTADSYLHDLYKELDKLSEELSNKERDRFQKLFYYDVIATAVRKY